MRNGSEGASPHRNDATVNPVTESISSRFLPKRPANQPVMGRMMALATRYEVSVQVASSLLADKLPAMCGSETFTTVVSSTSINVLDMTAMAISHGLMSRCSLLPISGIPYIGPVFPRMISNVIVLSFQPECHTYPRIDTSGSLR